MRKSLFYCVGVITLTLMLASCAGIVTNEGVILSGDSIRNPGQALNCHYVLNNINNYSFRHTCSLTYCVSKNGADTLSAVCSKGSGWPHHSNLSLKAWNKTGDISNCDGYLTIGPCK